ncbi:glutamate receptor ionotropic, kainate 2-like [Condylostylus longicornis]|uniref:glutamate receptor ionotropic, kainate 2-like n=1 Tax=Condylostylus longicornis TaxID=2530218 RepID=UPI00244E3CDB|nr:glutamate receptor ionotropic, kainate 2-like [Condylostylus longicornis]
MIKIIITLLFGINLSIGQINIGLVTESLNSLEEKIFLKAIEDANLKISDNSLEGKVANVAEGNVFDMSRKLCDLLKENVAMIIGPTSPASAEHAANICDAKELPFIDIRMDFFNRMSTINLYPSPSQYAEALKGLIDALQWSQFTILYESAGDDLILVNELVKLFGTDIPPINIKRYDLDLNGNYKPILRIIKKSPDFSLLVLGSTRSLTNFLTQAQQVGILTDAYRYIIGNLDMQTIDLEPFQYGEANITNYRMISPEHKIINELHEILIQENEALQNVTCAVSSHMALLYDGVQLIAETIEYVPEGAVELGCETDNTWEKGYTIVNHIKSLIIDGITGKIEFDNEGVRADIMLEAVELTASGIMKIGTWSSSGGYNNDRVMSSSILEADTRSLANKSFVVITALSDPYGMLVDSAEKLTGNDRFEGFGIELIQELSTRLGFTYTFRLQEDNKYGSKDAEGNWNGMILEILENRADLGITDLTMTSERESGVDFTIPFMNLGIAILYTKPKKAPPELFSFMLPFSGEVWGYLGVAYLSVSISLFILGRLSPVEWDNPYPCIEEPTELENQFSFANSMWFTIGALLQQGSEIAPKASSTRTVASIWWFFTLILVSSYTANLAAFLTVENPVTIIESAEDLAANKGGVRYGAKKGGSTYNFFKDAKDETFQKMYEYMKDHPEHQPSTNAEGVSRVENPNDNYAFLMESTSIEYVIERKCTLTQVGKNLDEKGYGIAMRKNWPYRDALSKTILVMQEDGSLLKMKNKWWKEKRGGGACADSGADSGGAVALEIANLGGVFLVLILGSIFAIFISIFENCFAIKQEASKNKTSYKKAMFDEIKFIFKCSGNVKTVEFLNNTTMSTLASSSSSSKSSSSSASPTSSMVASTLISRESNMIPSICSNITNKINHCNQETLQQQQQQQHQQQQNSIFSNGTASILQLKQSPNNNLPNNLIIIKNDNNLIKLEENQDMEKTNCSNYGKIFFNTQIIEDQLTPTRYCDEHRCDICGITFSSVDVFKKHVQVMHQIPLETNDFNSTNPKLTTTVVNNYGQGLYQCHLCSKSYKIKARLRLHLKVKHCLNINPVNKNNNNCNENNENIKNNATKLKICEKIRILTTNLKATNTNVVTTATTAEPIKIEAIDINNDEIGNENLQDIQIVKPEPIPKPWKCDICSKFYTTKYFLKKHKRIHTGETPYKCNICNKLFTFQQSYHKHLLYHSDDKPHVCKICNRAFKELSTLHNHERIHSGEKPFECEICGKRFRQRVSNYVHQRTHTGAKPYSCESCFRKFRYKVTLRTHKCSTLNESLKIEKTNDEHNDTNLDQLNNNIKIENLENKIEKLKNNNNTIENLSTVDDNLQKLLQNVDILHGCDDLLPNSISNDLICHNNDFKGNDCDINKEIANKSIDELVAESCNKLGIGNCNNMELTQNYNSSPITNDTPSPSEQLQHLCLYSPNSIEDNLNVHLNINDDSLKQFLFEIENDSKHS